MQLSKEVISEDTHYIDMERALLYENSRLLEKVRML